MKKCSCGVIAEAGAPGRDEDDEAESEEVTSSAAFAVDASCAIAYVAR